MSQRACWSGCRPTPARASSGCGRNFSGTAFVALTLGEIAVRYGCELHGDPDTVINRVATLAGAADGSVSFLANAGYRSQLSRTGASAVILAPADVDTCPVSCLVSSNPYAVYALVAQALYPEPPAQPGVHPSAVIGADCVLGEGVSVAAGVVLGDRVTIGDRSVLGPNCVVGDDVTIAADCRFIASVTLYHDVKIGARCRVHAGSVIGSDGFGMAPGESGWIKVPQVGSVVIGNDVEIGANCCIDRGAIDDTRLEDDVKLDNQVQIAHNVVIGAHTAIAGQSGVAGSTTIGERCLIGGSVAVSGHIKVADGVTVMGRGNVSKTIEKPGVYSAVFSVEEAGKWRRIAARVKRLDSMATKLRELEAALKKLAQGKDSSA